MVMSLLMVQPLPDAGKNTAAGTGTSASSRGQGNGTGNLFQALLDGRIAEHRPESTPVAASSDVPQETVSDTAFPAAQPEKGAEAEPAQASGQVGEEEDTSLAEQDEKGDVQTVSDGEAAVLAQIMAAMAGAQPLQAETVEVSGEDAALLTDENGVPLLAAVSGEAAEDSLLLPVTAETGDDALAGRQDGKADGAVYGRVQAEAGKKAADTARPLATEEQAASGRADTADGDAENMTAMTPARTTASAATTAAASSGAGEARQMPAVSQQGALPSSSEQAVFMQPVQPVAQAAAAAVPVNAGPVEARIMQPVGTPEWNQAIGQRVLWMVGQEQQSASLMLNPPDLGPVRVVVSVSNNHASANFFSANPDVRQALEGSLPRLREMMEGAGIQLGQAQVGAENSGGFQQEAGTSGGRAAGNGSDRLDGEGGTLAAVTGTAGSVQAEQVIAKGLVDTFV